MISPDELDATEAAIYLAEERGGKSDAALVMECAQVRVLLDTVKEQRAVIESLTDGTPITKAKIRAGREVLRGGTG